MRHISQPNQHILRPSRCLALLLLASLAAAFPSARAQAGDKDWENVKAKATDAAQKKAAYDDALKAQADALGAAIKASQTAGIPKDALERTRLEQQGLRERKELAARQDESKAAGRASAATALAGYSVCSLPADAQLAFNDAYWTGVLRELAINAVTNASKDHAAAQVIPGKLALLKESASKDVDLILKDAPARTIQQLVVAISKHALSADDQKPDDVRVLQPKQAIAFLNIATDLANQQEKTEQPRNLLCSESILDWAEVSDALGRRIANEYIVLQVTVRNLDPDHEFLLHDVQALLNTQRFHATRDRKVVRGVGEVGQLVGPRAVLINTATALGSATGAGQAALSVQGNIGLNIWNAGVVPGLKLVFPDHSVRQLSRLDDLGFSPGASTMVIPKSSAIAVMVFLPQKGFLWHCSEDRSEANPGMCNESDIPTTWKLKKHWYLVPTLHPVAKGMRELTTAEVNWLQDRVEILVAGTHVTAVNTTKTKAAVTKFTCDPVAYQRMFKKPDAPVDCAVEGTGLTAVGSIRLFANSDPSVNKVETVLTVEPGSDGKKATATFAACLLNELPAGKYALYADGGVETAAQGVSWTKSGDPLTPAYTVKDKDVIVTLPKISDDELKTSQTIRVGNAKAAIAVDAGKATYTFAGLAAQGIGTVQATVSGATLESCRPAKATP